MPWHAFHKRQSLEPYLLGAEKRAFPFISGIHLWLCPAYREDDTCCAAKHETLGGIGHLDGFKGGWLVFSIRNSTSPLQ